MMPAAPSLPVDPRTQHAIETVYREFRAPVPSVIEGCPCCLETRGVDVLLTTPLRELTGEALARYASGAFLTVGGERDFGYLLPRILETAIGDPPGVGDAEIVLGKLALANWRSWPDGQRRAVEDLIDAWFGQALSQDLAEAGDGWVGREAESVLCGAARAGLPLARWLARLREPEAAPVLGDLRNRFPRHLSDFWKSAPAGLEELSKALADERLGSA